MTTGLVIGKFLPPHLGHVHLFEVAAAACRDLHICLLAAPQEEPVLPRLLRHAWLTQLAPYATVSSSIDDHPVDYADPKAYALWVETIRRATGRDRFDLLFTSEPAYGDETARRLDARHVLVDAERVTVPTSASAIRADAYTHWAFIPRPVRAHYAARVLITGAESTGTTSLASDLAALFRTTWVPEYGREYSVPKDARGEPWSTAEFLEIALVQQRREDEAAAGANRIVFCDTDTLATAVWHRQYLGSFGSPVAAASWADRYDLILLAGTDFEWQDDGTRNSDDVRQRMQGWIVDELVARRRRYIELRGTHPERIGSATRAIAARLGLSPPQAD